MRVLAAILALAVAGGGSPAWAGSTTEAGQAAEDHSQAGLECGPSIQAPAAGEKSQMPPEPGKLRLALGALLLAPEEGTIPPEPRRETPPGSRKSFLRSRGAAVLIIVAGAILVGSVAKNSILRDS